MPIDALRSVVPLWGIPRVGVSWSAPRDPLPCSSLPLILHYLEIDACAVCGSAVGDAAVVRRALDLAVLPVSCQEENRD